MAYFIERREKKRASKKSIAVLYHRDCSDGFGAAWAAWKKFGDSAEYIGMVHDHTDPPRWLKGKKVYLLDFCYTKPRLDKLRKMAKSVAAIDHHVSLKDAAESVPDHLYAVDHSGSVLSWMYFHPKKPTPMLLRYIEEVDLWRFSLPHIWEIRASLYNLYDFDFRTWNILARDFENKRALQKYVNEGKLIAEYERRAIDKLVQRADLVRIQGYTALAVNSAMYSSELGAKLAELLPPLGIVYSFAEGEWRVSLRANNKGKKKVDCAKFAQKYEGGGHRFASGFTIPANKPLPWKRIK